MICFPELIIKIVIAGELRSMAQYAASFGEKIVGDGWIQLIVSLAGHITHFGSVTLAHMLCFGSNQPFAAAVFNIGSLRPVVS